MDILVKQGNAERLGAFRKHNGINFALEIKTSKYASDCDVTLRLFSEEFEGGMKDIDMPPDMGVGNVRAVLITGLSDTAFVYQYIIGGENCPDPYARAMVADKYYIPVDFPFVSKPLMIPYEEMVLYKLHVKGFTASKEARVKHPGTFRGVTEKIPYMKKLGITSALLMPVYEFDRYPVDYKDMGAANAGFIPKENYWGYASGQYFIPKRSYAGGEEPDIALGSMIDILHANGLECLLEFYFDEETSSAFVCDVLRFYVLKYHVDGFHILGNGDFMKAVLSDPLLGKTKLLYLGFDSDKYSDKNRKFKNLGEYNLGYEQDMRRFLRGDQGSLLPALYRIRRLAGDFGVINYFADHDGFTMMDMVSYEVKRNLENGEDNTDGTENNFSWNCGFEGETRRLKIRNLRSVQLKNAWLLLLLSEGVPMIYAGDEICNSQGGNNNAYCQDNEVGWVSWKENKFNKDILSFVKACIIFRKAHTILHMKDELRESDYKNLGFPELSYHGEKAWFLPDQSTDRAVGILLNGSYANEEALYIAINMHYEVHTLALPSPAGEEKWYVTAGTESGFYAEEDEKLLADQKEK